jgi:integrating conjugative element protein (TIGR03759 family)
MCRTVFCAAALALVVLGTATAMADQADSIPTQTTETETALGISELRRAQQWQLTAAEWRRYEVIMEGIRGSVSAPTISPVEVLGIHARDDTERRRYAERWAELMHEDTARVLAFQLAYGEAFRRLYGDEPMIDLDTLPGAAPALSLQPGDRLLFFARTNCGRCDVLLPQLLRRVEENPGVGLDIYLTDSAEGDEDKIRDWANARGIPPARVRSRAITLNHDHGLLAQLAGTTKVPHTVHRRADRFTPLKPASLRRLR